MGWLAGKIDRKMLVLPHLHLLHVVSGDVQRERERGGGGYLDAAPFAIQERFGSWAGEVPSPSASNLKLPVCNFAGARLGIGTVFEDGAPAGRGEPATERSGDGLPTAVVPGVRWLMLEVRRPSTAGELGARIRTVIGSSRR